jgi:hypothetical protein
VRPASLRELAEIHLLGTATARADSTRLVETLERFAMAAAARADVLDNSPVRPTAEIDTGWARCVEPELGATVRLLLDALGRPGGPDPAELARAVAGQPLPRACAGAIAALAGLRET